MTSRLAGLLFEPEQIFHTTAKRPGQTQGHQGGGQIETRLDAADGLPCHPSAPGQFLLIQPQAQAERFQIIVEATARKLGVRSHRCFPVRCVCTVLCARRLPSPQSITRCVKVLQAENST